MVAPNLLISSRGLMQNGKAGIGNKNHSKQKRASLTSQQSEPITDHPIMEQRKESVAEYLARGGRISTQPPVRTISWEEARDLIEKLAYQVEARKEDEAELDKLDQAEGFQIDHKEEDAS